MKTITKALLFLASTLLFACSGDINIDPDEYSRSSQYQQDALYFTYPMHQQRDVAPQAPIVLSYLQPVDLKFLDFELDKKDASGNWVNTKVLDGEPNRANFDNADNGKSLVITPGKWLDTNTTYRLRIVRKADQKEISISDKLKYLEFTTRPALVGPYHEQLTDVADFKVTSISPNPADASTPFLDFSTINVTFTHPLDLASLEYGANIKLEQGGKVVPARIWSKGRMLTIDPEEDFKPEVPVTLTLTTGIKSQAQAALPADVTRTFNPLDTHPRSTQALEVTEADCQGTSSVSPLTGKNFNCIPVVARLLGHNAQNPDTVSSQAGSMFAELAYTLKFDGEALPLIMRKGSQLVGSQLAVKVGGKVDAGYSSGPVTATFVSDGNGYLIDNPYTDNPAAPKRMILTADMAFDTAGSEEQGTKESRANGAFTQKLMHVTMVGAAYVDVEKQRLVADAVAIVELSVMGLEHGYGLLSFHMESYVDQKKAIRDREKQLALEDQFGPARPLELSSWVPGIDGSDPEGEIPCTGGVCGGDDNLADVLDPDDPLVLIFNKPLDIKTVKAEHITLEANGAALVANTDFTIRNEGTAIVINLTNGLQYNTKYELSYNDKILDLDGRPDSKYSDKKLTFKTVTHDGVHNPVIITSYPGFPCATENLNLPTHHGHCVGGKTAEIRAKDGRTVSQQIMVSELPANRFIDITFSQILDAGAENAFSIVKCDEEPTGNVSACATETTVDGKLEVGKRKLRFTPHKPWEIGKYYKYTIKADAASACGVDALCAGGKKLWSQILNAQIGGGGNKETDADIVVFFKAVEPSPNVLQILYNRPSADVNSDFELKDASAGGTEQNAGVNPRAPMNSAFLDLKSFGGGITEASVGTLGGNDDSKKYIYKTAGLIADIAGYHSISEIERLVAAGKIAQADVLDSVRAAGGAVLVYLNPTNLLTTSVTTFAKVLGLIDAEIPTGAQIMRIAYPKNDDGKLILPVGWIIENEGRAQFTVGMNILLDAPYMEIMLGGTHSLHAYPLPRLTLAGGVDFLADGRLQIQQLSTHPMDIDVDISVLGGMIQPKMTLEIPRGGVFLNYIGVPVEN